MVNTYRFSLLRDEKVTELRALRLDGISKSQHSIAPLLVRRPGPGLQGGFARADGTIKVVCSRDGNLLLWFQGAWVDPMTGLLRCGTLAVDDLHKVVLKVHGFKLITPWLYIRLALVRRLLGIVGSH